MIVMSSKLDHDLFYATLSITHCFVNINGLRASFLQDYEVQNTNHSEFSTRIQGAQPLFLFPIFKGSIFIFWGWRNKLYINNQFRKCSVLLSFFWFCFCLKMIMFSAHSLFLLLMKVRIFRSPRCYSLLPWSPPLYCRWNGQFGSQYRDHHEDEDHSFYSRCSLLNLILCFQFVCSRHVTIRVQHKTNDKSWLK